MIYSSFLSPIDDYSNLPFRLLCQKYGAEAVCVPLINSTAIARDRSKISIVDAHPDEKNIGVQIVGNDPNAIGVACKTIAESMPFVSWLNINCGCPSVRTMNTGGGSALLQYPEKIVQSILQIKNQVGIPVSVKIRIKNNFQDTLSLCKELERAGADFLIIHGRTPQQGYSGKADWQFIKSLKERLNIPLVGNGDIISASQGRKAVVDGCCDAFMIARAAMSNPLVFENGQTKTTAEKFSILEEYIFFYKRYIGKPELRDVKLKAVQFMSCAPNAAELRNRICRATSVEEIESIKEVAHENPDI